MEFQKAAFPANINSLRTCFAGYIERAIDISGKRKKKAPKKKRRTGLRIIIILLVLLVIGYLACCVMASGSTFLNNVSVAGVQLGGMTYEQGRQAVLSSLDSGSSDLHLDVRFPDYTLQIPVAELAVDSDIDLCVKKAYDFGHDNFFTGGLAFIKSLILPQEFYSVSLADKAEIGAMVDSAAQLMSEYKEYSVALSVSQGTMSITKGVSQVDVDTEKVTDDIVKALEKSSFSPIDFSGTLVKRAALDLDALYDEIFTLRRDAYYDEQFNVVEEVVGVSFDVDGAEALLAETAPGGTAVVPLILDIPNHTAEELSAQLYDEVLAEYSTYVTNDSNRNNNIDLACKALDGLVLLPGEEFSYNDALGERTTDRGYKYAGAYANGKVVEEIGGGICQVSSTLYMVSLLADLEIVERVNHMFVVSYVPLGMDAAVSWGTCDYRFKNNTDSPIKLEAYLADGAVTIRFLGSENTGNYVKMTYEVLETYPYETIEQEDENIAPGDTKVDTTGSTGYKVRSYRHVYDSDDNLLSSEFEASSSYIKRDKIILVAVGESKESQQESSEGDIPQDDVPDTEPEQESGVIIIDGTI